MKPIHQLELNEVRDSGNVALKQCRLDLMRFYHIPGPSNTKIREPSSKKQLVSNIKLYKVGCQEIIISNSISSMQLCNYYCRVIPMNPFLRLWVRDAVHSGWAIWFLILNTQVNDSYANNDAIPRWLHLSLPVAAARLCKYHWRVQAHCRESEDPVLKAGQAHSQKWFTEDSEAAVGVSKHRLYTWDIWK